MIEIVVAPGEGRQSEASGWGRNSANTANEAFTNSVGGFGFGKMAYAAGAGVLNDFDFERWLSPALNRAWAGRVNDTTTRDLSPYLATFQGLAGADRSRGIVFNGNDGQWVGLAPTAGRATTGPSP